MCNIRPDNSLNKQDVRRGNLGESAKGLAGAGGRGATPHLELATATRVDTVGGAKGVSKMFFNFQK